MFMLVISYSSDIVKSTYNTLEASDIGTYLRQGMSVSLKPNLVVAGPASNGAVTHPEVAEGVIRYLMDFGIHQVKIIESSSLGVSTTDAYKYSGFAELTHKYDVPLIDLKKSATATLSHNGLDIEIYRDALDTDFLINLPVLKAHCQTRMTCCLKNLKGCIPDSEKRRFHALGIHKPVAVLSTFIKTGYCVVDGICGDLTFEEGGNPVTSNRIIAGHDPLTVDSYCAALIGYHPDDIEYLSLAKNLGIGVYCTDNTKIIEIGIENKPHNNVSAIISPAAERYRSLIDDRSACSVCYASLIHALHRMDFHRTGGRSSLQGKIHIGQGYKGKKGAGLGIGTCTQGFDNHISGCPPTAAEILRVLR